MYKYLLLLPMEYNSQPHGYDFCKSLHVFVKKSYLFIISSRRKCNLLENVIEFELIYLNFNVYTVRINSLFMTLLI